MTGRGDPCGRPKQRFYHAGDRKGRPYGMGIVKADQIEKSTDKVDAFFWWGMVDSNHRRRCQQIYSLSPLATREIPHMKLELVDGFEPPTC